MNQPDDLVADSVRRLLARHGAHQASRAVPIQGLPVDLWRAIVDAGLPLVLVSEPGSDPRDALRDGVTILRECAYQSAPVPLAEAMLANWLIGQAGWPPEPGFATVAIADDRAAVDLPAAAGAGAEAMAILVRTPWGRAADAVYALARDGVLCRVIRVDAAHWKLRAGLDLAGEPRDTLEIDSQAIAAARVSAAAVDALELLALAALLRAAQMVGAMERTLALALEHARTRVQFGRTIGSFQAVQQMLAQHASHVAAAAAAVDLAVDAWGSDSLALYAGIAKSRAGEAAGFAAECAHQVIAAMGYAMEHPLQLATRRLWSWRDEYGNESFWNERIGSRILMAGAANAWPLLVDRVPSMAIQ